VIAGFGASGAMEAACTPDFDLLGDSKKIRPAQAIVTTLRHDRRGRRVGRVPRAMAHDIDWDKGGSSCRAGARLCFIRPLGRERLRHLGFE